MTNDNQISTVPDMTLTAAGSDRQIALAHIGIPTLLIFFGQRTASVMPHINDTVRDTYPQASSVVIASIVDLRSVPRLLHSVAKRELKKIYATTGEHMPDHLNPEDYILILPDWDGVVHKALDLTDTDKNAAIVVLDRGGQIVGIEQNDHLPESALRLLKEAD
jgi:hypothetical protein